MLPLSRSVLLAAALLLTPLGGRDAVSKVPPQSQYDAAREVEERSQGDACTWAAAHVRVLDAEAVDRLDPARTRAAARLRSSVAAGRCPAIRRRARPAPPPTFVATPVRGEDAVLSARLARAARTFGGIAATWTHDLTTGSWAAWNADARFPAASIVKLGLAVAAPREQRYAYDLEALLSWSSNLAANRLLERTGLPAVAAALRRMGATSSSYTGPYRVGTSRTEEPPLISSRVTTARDVGRMLFWLQAHRRAVILGYLLESEPFKDNVGILRPRDPAAQKHGWFSVVRHSAAIVYSKKGPRIIVVLTYAPDLTLAKAQRYGAQVMKAIGLASRGSP
jgi:beta-lactamase class A